MATCSKCGKEIENLVNWCPEWWPYRAFVGDDGTMNYETEQGLEPDPMNTEDQYYACPECGERLAETESEAIIVLKGGAK